MMKLITVLSVSSILASWVNCTREHKIIIIGAGPSGIATASKLLENDIDDILILEAESRIGGRVHTVNFEGRNIDIGGEWCHGQKGNIVYETLRDKNLLDLIEKEERAIQFYLSSRQNISREFSKELIELIEELYFQYEDPELNESLGSFLAERFNQAVATKFGHNSEQLKIALLAVNYLSHFVNGLEGSLSWNDPGAISEYEDCEGYHHLGWKNYGYGKFLDVLTKKYPNPKEEAPIDDKIILNKEVIKITVNDNDVSIFCSDNSTFKAKHVIFTPSLGVLKNQFKSLFVPELPKNKTLAIERIGIGAVMKVFLKYETNWWGSAPGFNFIWTHEDRLAAKKTFAEGPRNTNEEPWIVEMYNVLAMPRSNILLVWLTGEMVPVMERMDEKMLVHGIQYTLKKFLGHLYEIPAPQKIIMSNWYTNPHFRGTYSFASVNSTGDDIRNLAAPVAKANGAPILQFAGEATSLKYHSTVHGAVEAGFREANRLIKIYKNSVKNVI